MNSLLHIKSGIECKENRKGCNKCLTKTVHCHCCSFEITQQQHEEYLKVVSESKEQLEEERLKIRERIEKEIKEKKEVRKTKLSNSSQFCSPAHLEPLYEKNENKKTVVINAAPPQSGTAPVKVVGNDNNNKCGSSKANLNVPKKFMIPKKKS